MTKTRSLYSPAIPYKKPFEEKKLEKKDIERQVTYGVGANATVEKKKEKVYVFSGKSVEELIVCAERAKKVFGILRLPVGRWREEFANTLDTVLRKKFDQVVTDGDDDGNAFAQTQAGFTEVIKYFIRLFSPNPKAQGGHKRKRSVTVLSNSIQRETSMWTITRCESNRLSKVQTGSAEMSRWTTKKRNH